MEPHELVKLVMLVMAQQILVIFALYTKATGASLTEKLRVTSTGNVGLGTTAPLLKLDVAGSGRFTGAPMTSVLTGSIDAIASTTVTGVGTLFTTELVVGDRITITGETRTVTAIATNTSLTVDTATTDTLNDTTPDKLAAIFITRLSGNAIGMVQNDPRQRRDRDDGTSPFGSFSFSFGFNHPCLGSSKSSQ